MSRDVALIRFITRSTIAQAKWLLKKLMIKPQINHVNSRGELLSDTKYKPLVQKEEKSAWKLKNVIEV